MNDAAVQTILESGTFPPVLLVFGDEELLVEETSTTLYESARTLDATGMNCDVLDGDTTSVEAVLSLARSFPIMSDRRVIWVRHAEKMSIPKAKKSTEAITAFFKSPPETTFILLSASIPARPRGGSKKSSLKFPFDAIVGNGSFIEYPPMKEASVVSWLNARARTLAATLESGCAEFIVSQTGTSLRDNAMELDKLLAYLGTRKAATVEDALAIIGGSREYNIFELEAAISKAHMAKASTIMSKMLEGSAQPLAIISMLSRYFLLLFRLADLRGTDPTTITRTIGAPAWKIADYTTALDTFGVARIERALLAIRVAESRIKTSGMDTRAVMDIMLTQILDGISPR